MFKAFTAQDLVERKPESLIAELGIALQHAYQMIQAQSEELKTLQKQLDADKA